MRDFSISLLCIYVIYEVVLFWRRKHSQNKKLPLENVSEKDFNVEGKYQKKWLLSYNEKDAYKALKKVCDQNGFHLMAKVRLFDLVEARKDSPVFYTNKIRAKHVDFVICDERLIARCVVELDDSSHKAADRKERDEFVDAVLESVGYKVIHTEGITDEVITSIFGKLNVKH